MRTQGAPSNKHPQKAINFLLTSSLENPNDANEFCQAAVFLVARRECEKFQIAQVNKTGNVEVAGLK
jgi:hypothetical protein